MSGQGVDLVTCRLHSFLSKLPLRCDGVCDVRWRGFVKHNFRDGFVGVIALKSTHGPGWRRIANGHFFFPI